MVRPLSEIYTVIENSRVNELSLPLLESLRDLAVHVANQHVQLSNLAAECERLHRLLDIKHRDSTPTPAHFMRGSKFTHGRDEEPSK